MKRRTSWRLFVALATALGLGGCFIDPIEETAGISLALPGDVAQGSAAAAWDQQDRLHLDTFSKYVRLALSQPGEDYEQASAVWPPRSGEAKEGVDGEVTLDLQAAPGSYRVTVLGYAVENERFFAFQQRDVAPLDLVAGKSSATEIFLRLHNSGGVEVSLRCQSGAYLPFVTAQLSLVDARAHVVLPPVDIEGSPPTFSTVTIEGVPINRPFQARVIFRNQLDQKTSVLEVYAPTFSVDEVGGRKLVVLTVPCNIGR